MLKKSALIAGSLIALMNVGCSGIHGALVHLNEIVQLTGAVDQLFNIL